MKGLGFGNTCGVLVRDHVCTWKVLANGGLDIVMKVGEDDDFSWEHVVGSIVGSIAGAVGGGTAWGPWGAVGGGVTGALGGLAAAMAAFPNPDD